MRTATRSLIALLVVSAELALLCTIRFVVFDGACCCVPFGELPFRCRPAFVYMALAVCSLAPIAARSIASRMRPDALKSSRLLLVLGTVVGAGAGHLALRAVGYEGEVCGELPCTLLYELTGPVVLALGAGGGAFCATFLGGGTGRARWVRPEQ